MKIWLIYENLKIWIFGSKTFGRFPPQTFSWGQRPKPDIYIYEPTSMKKNQDFQLPRWSVRGVVGNHPLGKTMEIKYEKNGFNDFWNFWILGTEIKIFRPRFWPPKIRPNPSEFWEISTYFGGSKSRKKNHDFCT